MLRIFHGDEMSHTANDLRVIVRQCLKHWQPTLAQKQCQLVVDLNASMPVLCQAEDTQPLLNGLFELAVGRLSDQGELSIVSCRGAGTVDLEIADSGSLVPVERRFDRMTIPMRPNLNADTGIESYQLQLHQLQRLAHGFGGRVWATPCPQGGMAWTLRLPGRVAIKRAA